MTDWTADFSQPRQISERELQRHIAKGRQLHAEAVAAALRGLYRAPLELFRRVTGGSRSTLWRAPHTGNCLNG